MNIKYNILEHTADYGLEVISSSLNNLFVSSSMALVDCYFEPFDIIINKNVHINIDSEDVESLFVKWLNEIIYLIDGEKLIPVNIHIINSGNCILNAIVDCMIFNSEIHNIKKYIKGVTYYNLSLQKKNDEFTVRFYFDV